MFDGDIVETRRRPQVREVQGGVARVVLDVGERDFELGAAVRRFRVQKVRRSASERRGELVDHRKPLLAVPVLELGEIGGLASDERSELAQGEAAAAAEVAEALSEDERVERTSLHVRSIAILSRKCKTGPGSMDRG